LGKDKQQEIIDALRQAVWQKAIGDTEITPGSYYWKKISQAIEDTLGNPHSLHQDTIRNFFKGRHQPRPDTLDILSGYVIGDKDGPATFADFEQACVRPQEEPQASPNRAIDFRISWRTLVFLLAAICVTIIGFFFMPSSEDFTEEFDDVSDEALRAKRWMLQDPDPDYWKLRDTAQGLLTLFTLRGDNWVGEGQQPFLKNRLTRRIYVGDSYEIEFELRSFFPTQNFQQCGIMLMADSSLSSEMLRVVVAYAEIRDSLAYLKLQTARFEAGDTQRPMEYSWSFVISPVDSYERYRPDFKYNVVRLKVEKGFIKLYTCFGRRYSSSLVERRNDIPMDFRPRYLSLYAAGSQFPFPQSDTIPAMFDRVSVRNE
jgi:hypothetical protein